MEKQSNIKITISKTINDVNKTTIIEARIHEPDHAIKNILEHADLIDRVEYKLDEKSIEDIKQP